MSALKGGPELLENEISEDQFSNPFF